MNTEATIQIHRNSKRDLESVTVVMPTWEKEGDDGSTVINMPFFGIRLFAFNDMDVDAISHDAIKSFCINCDKFGLGLETELLSMGWSIVDTTTMIYNISTQDFVIGQILHTGENQPQFVNFKEENELVHA